MTLLRRADSSHDLQDRRLANHVLNVHKEGRAPTQENGQELLTPELLRAYVATAKTYQPTCPRDLTGGFLTQAPPPLCWGSMTRCGVAIAQPTFC